MFIFKKSSVVIIFFLTVLFLPLNPSKIYAQTKSVRLSIATGGTGGVYYPLGGGMAKIISKYAPNVEATAEVTQGSQANCQLINSRKSDLAFIAADTASDALRGQERFKSTGPIPLRTVAVVYSQYMHVVTLADSEIKSISDLKGKRVSVGAPGSGTEVISSRILESYGINTEKDLRRERLGAAEAVGAFKDRKVAAFTWLGGLPTAAVLDLAATPGTKIKILASADNLDKVQQKYGPIYFRSLIPKSTYPGMDADIPVAALSALLVCHEKMDSNLVYDIIKVLLEHQPELVEIHKEAKNFTLASATVGSSLPFHPGALKYFKEKGRKVN